MTKLSNLQVEVMMLQSRVNTIDQGYTYFMERAGLNPFEERTKLLAKIKELQEHPDYCVDDPYGA